MEAREVNKLLEDGNSIDESYAAQCKDKWAPLIEDVDNNYMAGVTAVLLENEMDHLKKLMTENTYASNAGEYTKFIFPVIRAVFPNLIATNICSVQPMNAPVGAIFFLKYKAGTTKSPTTTGDTFGDFGGSTIDTGYSGDKITVTNEASGFTPAGGATVEDLIYLMGVAPGGAGTDAAGWTGVVQGSFSMTDGTTTWTDDGNGNVKTSAGVSIGTLDYATGRLAVEFDGAAVEVTVTYTYHVDMGDVAEMNVDIEMSEVRAESRKLKAIWSSEAADDLKAFHGFDAESEIVSGISSEIALELDREIVASIEAAATHSGGAAFDLTGWSDAPTSYGYGHADYVRGVIKQFSTVSQAVYKSTFRAPANWAVTGPETIAFLDQLPEFVPIAGNEQHNLGVMKAGSLSGK